MAYNWNNELSGERKHELWMQISLGFSALLFVLVLASLSYFIAQLQIEPEPLVQTTDVWNLRR